MTLQVIMAALEANGSEQTKKVLKRHGAREPFYGVKIAFLKTLVKKVKKNHALSLALYETGNSDAMYLAGLIAEPEKMDKETLQRWVEKAYWYLLSECTVAWVTAESNFALELAAEWLRSDNECIASAGWATLSSYLSVTPNEKMELPWFEALLDRLANQLHDAPNRVRYVMNGFIIAAGCYVPALSAKAQDVAKKLGKVQVSMGETACKVPNALAYIEKVKTMGRLGKKRKTAVC